MGVPTSDIDSSLQDLGKRHGARVLFEGIPQSVLMTPAPKLSAVPRGARVRLLLRDDADRVAGSELASEREPSLRKDRRARR